MHIAILEPERRLADTLMVWLRHAGYSYSCCSDHHELVACLQQRPCDLLLVDCSCQGDECFELMLEARKQQAALVPLLFIGSPDGEAEIVRAFEYGADDYVVKPLAAEELLSRIHVLICRFSGAQDRHNDEVLVVGPYRVDLQQRKILRNEQPLPLTDKDFSLAAYLFSHPNELLSRHRLLSEVWGVSQQVNTRTVDMHISRLRKGLKLAGSGYEIKTIHHYGYSLQVPDAHEEG